MEYGLSFLIFRSESTMQAMLAQSRFLAKVFIPMVNAMDAPIHVDNHYVGSAFGNLSAGKFNHKLIFS